MISRLTASAAIFAILATAGFAVAADASLAPTSARPAAQPMQVVVLPRVEITGQRATGR